MDTIGEKHTPMRAMIHAAAEHMPRPVTLISVVVVNEDLAGIFIGDPISTWEAAADLSAQRHIKWFDGSFQRVFSWAPPMYDELWTAGKAMYKLEPVVADGGEVIIYAPHLQVVSRMHGEYLFEVGYHVLDYFLKQWDRFDQVPLGVLAHSTHMRGAGRYEEGQERSRVKVTLSSRIPKEDCQRLSLGYLNPAEVDINKWQGRESEGILFVPKAGEILHRLRD
jgi:nickel-dependent lactate racemase